jgi:hypothetical protein
MPGLGTAAIVAAVLLDLLWWVVADRSVRRSGGGRWLRALVLLFAAFQAVWLVWFLRPPAFTGHPLATSAFDLANAAWHLLIAPLTVLVAGAGRLIRALRGYNAESAGGAR